MQIISLIDTSLVFRMRNPNHYILPYPLESGRINRWNSVGFYYFTWSILADSKSVSKCTCEFSLYDPSRLLSELLSCSPDGVAILLFYYRYLIGVFSVLAAGFAYIPTFIFFTYMLLAGSNNCYFLFRMMLSAKWCGHLVLLKEIAT